MVRRVGTTYFYIISDKIIKGKEKQKNMGNTENVVLIFYSFSPD